MKNTLATLRQTAKLALPFACLTLVLLSLAVSASGQGRYTLTVRHNASNVGVVSPGCAAVVEITGGQFLDATYQTARNPLPYEMAGVSVEVDGIQAPIRFVSPTQLAILAPDVRFPPKRKRVMWYALTVRTASDVFSGWIAYAPVAPGIYEQTDGKFTHAQGFYLAGPQTVLPITDTLIPAGAPMLLFGSGMRDAKTLRVWLDDGEDVWIIPASLAVSPSIGGTLPGWAGFPWIEGVAFDLPADAHGRLVLVVQADTSWSQEVWLDVK